MKKMFAFSFHECGLYTVEFTSLIRQGPERNVNISIEEEKVGSAHQAP